VIRRVLGGLGLTALTALAVAVPAAHGQFIRRLPESLEGQQPRRAPMTLTPTLTLSEEFNDNIFVDNDQKVWDFITGITPGLTFEVERPTYRVFVAADSTAAIYARESDETDVFERAGLLGEVVLRLDPQWTVTITELFTFSHDTFAVNTESVSTGRDRSLGNTLSAGAAFQMDRLTALRGGASWNTQRYDDPDLVDSDTFRVQVGADRAFTPRLTGIAEYEFDYFSFSGLPDVSAHTPRVGVTYAITPTLTGSLRAGPTFEVREDDTNVVPSVIASLRQRTSWGAIGFDYSHLVSTTGGLGGTSHNHSIGGSVDVTRWIRNLVIQVSPLVSIIDRVDSSEDIVSFTLPIQVSYHFTPYIAVIAGYQFFHQRTDAPRAAQTAGTALATDADQNRVFVGIQFGYPIRFD
jgi:hypothetical protein